MLEIIIGILVCSQFIMWAYFQTEINILTNKMETKEAIRDFEKNLRNVRIE